MSPAALSAGTTTVSLGWASMASIPAGPLLLVSPHLDDAVFSCAALVERPEPIDVVTVFAGEPDPPRQSWWDVECGFASSAESVPARRLEDEQAFAGTGHRRTYLDLFELQYVDRRSPGERETVTRAIGEWIAGHPTGTVALPVGAGCSQRRRARWLRRLRRRECSPPQHPDHLYVRDAALDLLERSGTTLLLYEEIPYLWGGRGEPEAVRISARGGWRAEPFELGVDRARKAERAAAYASQIPHISPPHGRLDQAATFPEHERYWRLVRDSSTSA
jgi:LmbE family N-acetylglucosaminyl deacetylase